MLCPNWGCRLPPPIQPLKLKTWDGSVTDLPAADGGPVIIYDAQDGKLGVTGKAGDSPILGVARPADPTDKYVRFVLFHLPFAPLLSLVSTIAVPCPAWFMARNSLIGALPAVVCPKLGPVFISGTRCCGPATLPTP